MTNAELRELVHLLMMCGIMDKTATESENVTNEEWLRMKNLIDKYQAEKEVPEPKGDLISREALKETIELEEGIFWDSYSPNELVVRKKYIDNATPVKFSLMPADESKEEAYMRGYENGKVEGILKASTRPQAEWITCTKSGMPLTEQGRLSGEKWYGFKCSNPECNYIYKGNALTESPFCQKCGADMQIKENSNG